MAGKARLSSARRGAIRVAWRRAELLYAKVCAKREDFGDATGARTFLSAATPEYPTGSERPRALLPFDIAADKNVRAPLWFRLRRLGDRCALPPRELLPQLILELILRPNALASAFVMRIGINTFLFTSPFIND